MAIINLLMYVKRFRQEEIFTFMKMNIDVYSEFLNKEERTEINLLSTEKDLIKNYLDNLINRTNTYGSILKVPRKFIESDELSECNKIRVRICGDIKKLIRMQYDNTQSVASIILWNLFRIFKNMRQKNMNEISGIITNLLIDLKSDIYKDHCTTLKLDGMIAKLEDENNKFIRLYSSRGYKKETIVTNSVPSRKECQISYQTLIEYTNSLIVINHDNTDLKLLATKLNAIVNPFNDKIRSRMKKNKDKPEIINEDDFKFYDPVDRGISKNTV